MAKCACGTAEVTLSALNNPTLKSSVDPQGVTPNASKRGDDVALAPTANQISVREVLAKFEAEFASMTHAVDR